VAAPPTRPPEKFLTIAEMMNISDAEARRRMEMLEFGHDDEARLRAVSDLAERYATDVIDAIYRHLLHFPEMQAFFPTRELLERVKGQQREYFLRLTQGNYDMGYVENRLSIGAIHERINLPMKFYLAMYNFYLREVGNRLMDEYRDDPKQALETLLSLMKLTFFDMELAIDTYIDARERTIRALQQEAIRELSTPVLPFRQGMLLLPIIGQIDSPRARQLTEHLLESIRTNRAKVVVIDITGVATVDSRVANHLVQTIDAARLMGAHVIVSGISPVIALTMVTLGIDLGRVVTVGDMQSGIERAESLLQEAGDEGEGPAEA